jgi:ribosomal protein S18 acetylase RimI-like enzyme
VWPSEEQYDSYFPPFVEAFAGQAFEHGSGYAIGDVGAVALWLPPGVHSNEVALAALAEATIDPASQDEVFAFLTMQTEAHPREPHWYLPLIGVDPEYQGLGFGSALLEHTLTTADVAGIPCYLEATSERNRALYARYGFKVMAAIQFGSSPTMWPMWRSARDVVPLC